MTSRSRDHIRFNVLRNALYHTARRRTLERLNRGFNFAVVVLGAAAVGDSLGRIGIESHWLALAIAVIAALQLVFDFGRQARDHQALQRDYYSLLADIEATPEADTIQCAAWYGRMISITADEPPVLRAIDAKAYNDAIDATGDFDRAERLIIPPLHRVFGWFIPFEGHEYRKVSECAGRGR